MNIFVAGTDTGVGKTVVSTALCLKLNWNYWKPIQSGLDQETDREWVGKYLTADKIVPETYRLRRPLSPHISAFKDGIEIDLEALLRTSAELDHTVIEGAGGLLVPLNQDQLLIDLIQKIKASVLLVARSGLGTLNHTLLSIEAFRHRGMEPLGVVMVGDLNDDNREALEYYGQITVLGQIPKIPQFTRQALYEAGLEIKLEGKDYEYSRNS